MPLKKREEKKGSRGAKMGGKAALMMGGAGLLLFVLGVKRRHRLEDGHEIVLPDGGADKAAGAAE